MGKAKIFSKGGWRRQRLKILLAERFRGGVRLVVEPSTDYHLSSKTKRRVLKRQGLLDKASGVITWHSVTKVQIPKHTPAGLDILAGQH